MIHPLAPCCLVLATAFAASSLAQTVMPSKKVVFVTPGTAYSPLTETEISEFKKLAPSLQLVFPPRARLMAEIVDADAIIGSVTPEMIRAAKKLKWVQVTSAGVERFMFPELKDSAITLTNMKIVQGVELADQAFALLLGLTRCIDQAMAAKQTETWSAEQTGPLLELRDKTAVIVGVGGAGTQIAIRAKAFGMTVIGVDPRDIPITPFLDRTVWPDRLESVLPEADVVFISAPHTPQTEKMMGAPQFAKMKAGAFFICVSRGKIYDAMALADAVKSGHLAGAGVDVTDPEPLPKGHPLWKLDRVIITPHIAGRSDGETARYLDVYKENLVRFANGEPLRNTVDKAKGY
jgi:D-2-hydroxyacid dehydrogenase (NADP+)